jgi:release factor glutamine methyltransferase
LRDLLDILRFKTKNFNISLEHAEVSVSTDLRKKLESNLLEGVPLSMLMGFSEFYHHRFYIDEHVLIPRPETEYMVDLLVFEFKGKANNVLDIGVGSGVILLSLLNFGVGKSGVGIDNSLEALNVAKINTRRLKLQDKVILTKGDRLFEVRGKFDLIVSNPPYIKAHAHSSLVHPSVHKHEPHNALYLPDDGYEAWFLTFFQSVKSHLNGVFMMEGHELELDEQAKMLKFLGFQNVQVLKDLSGAKRYLRGFFSFPS